MTPFQRLIRLYHPVGVVLVTGVLIVPCIGIMGYAFAVADYGVLLGAFLCIVVIITAATLLFKVASIRKSELPTLASQLGVTSDIIPAGLTLLTKEKCVLPDDARFMAELIEHIPELFRTPA